MIALATNTAPPRSHNIDTLVDLLPTDERNLWAVLTAHVDTAEFRQWRQGGTHTADLPIDGFDEDYLATVATVALNVAAHVTRHCAAAGIDATQVHLSTRSERRLRTALEGPLRVETDHPIRHPATAPPPKTPGKSAASTVVAQPKPAPAAPLGNASG